MLSLLISASMLLGDQTEDYAWFPDSASTFATDVDSIYGWISAICVVFFVPIVICLFGFALKYRKPKGTKAESQTAHNTPIELAWSIIPSFFLIGMFYFGADAYLDHRMVPDDANEINVQAFKWGWTINYGSGVFNPELHILVDEPTKLTMQSSDVIHSLFVPAFRAKKDVVPGRYNYMWFKPTLASEKVSDDELSKAKQWTKESGSEWDYDKWQFTPDGYSFFDLYCTEYCGDNHSEMQTVVVVHKTQEDLDAWIKKYSSRDPSVPLEVYGETLYSQRGCAGCHSVDGSARVGPTYKDLYGKTRKLKGSEPVMADENYLRESILYPKSKIAEGYQPVMPSYKGQLSDDDVASLVEYIKTLSSAAPVSPAEKASDSDSEGAKADAKPTEENKDKVEDEPAN